MEKFLFVWILPYSLKKTQSEQENKTKICVGYFRIETGKKKNIYSGKIIGGGGGGDELLSTRFVGWVKQEHWCQQKPSL